MSGPIALPLAAAAAFPWMNLFWVLVAITALLFAVAGVGRWLAATHPEPAPRSRPAPAPAPAPTPEPSLPAGLAPEIQAAIAAAVYATCGPAATITTVVLQPGGPDNPMMTWSLEGRRQIYTSHKVR